MVVDGEMEFVDRYLDGGLKSMWVHLNSTTNGSSPVSSKTILCEKNFYFSTKRVIITDFGVTHSF